MAPSRRHAPASALRLLERLPGIGDVVWAAVTRLAESRVATSVLFTAPGAHAGTTVLAAATAVGLAQHQRVPVCLVETNVRRPALAQYLGLEGAGLSDVLDGHAELEDCLQEPRDCPGLFVLPAGTTRAPIPGEFTTEHMSAVLASLRRRCHYLVLDAAPVLEHVEARLLLRQADAVLLVLRARVTRADAAERALGILLESGTPVLGSIFNAYRPESLFGGNLSANRSFRRALRARREHVMFPPRRKAAAGTNGTAPEASVPASVLMPLAPAHEAPLAGNGVHPEANGVPPLEAQELPEEGSEAAHRRQIDILERRIVKLMQRLEQTEADLRRIAAMKEVDLGIASTYRGVQGLSPEEEALASKRSLMQEIFQANLELKTAMARHP